MKIPFIFLASVFCVFLSSCAWNSNSAIIQRGEAEFSEVLQPGTEKSQIIKFLDSKGYYYSEVSKEDTDRYYRKGECPKFSKGDFKWSCQYYGYVFTRRDAGFLSITDPSFWIYFFINKDGVLVAHKSGVTHTFL